MKDYIPEYLVVSKPKHIPAGHKAMGFGIAHAIFSKRSTALRWQLNHGLSATTEIIKA